MAAEEATNRLTKAQATFKDAKTKADAAKEALKLKLATVEDLRIEKEKAAKILFSCGTFTISSRKSAFQQHNLLSAKYPKRPV